MVGLYHRCDIIKAEASVTSLPALLHTSALNMRHFDWYWPLWVW